MPAAEHSIVARLWARPVAVGVVLVVVVLAVYLASNPQRTDDYNHFVWQAQAWLDGQTSIPYPVVATAEQRGNDYFQDVLPIVDSQGRDTGRGILPFPPLPALVLLPFVAVLGLATPAQLIAAFLGALDVGVAWWLLGRLRVRQSTRLATAILLALGTVFWYAAKLGTTWYLAHLVAVGLLLGAVGLALRPGLERPTATTRVLDPRFFAAGLLFGLACAARLSIVFGAPFFAVIVPPEGRLRRIVSAAIGVAFPLVALVTYNLVSTGHVMNPAYDYLYQLEAYGYPDLGYRPDWAIEDVRYIPGHLVLMLVGLPKILPPCLPGLVRAPFDPDCAIAMPDPVGMGLLLTTPAYLLAVPALRRPWSRVVVAGVVASVPIAVFDLAHFSQGWVQFGYRFSLDFLPFLLPAIALGIERIGARRWPVVGLIAISVAVTAWGVAWGGILGW